MLNKGPGYSRRRLPQVGRMPIPVGERSGKIVLIERLERHKNGNFFMLRCKCDCGNEEIYSTATFRRRFSCKPCSKARSIETRTTHGASKRGARTPLYAAYKAMISRCENPKVKGYRWYGAKGISVCAEWRNDFATFRAWALANGWAKGLTLERKNPRLGYCPENCEYITQSENSRRMRDLYVVMPRDQLPFSETLPIEALWGIA